MNNILIILHTGAQAYENTNRTSHHNTTYHMNAPLISCEFLRLCVVGMISPIDERTGTPMCATHPFEWQSVCGCVHRQ